MFTSKLILFLVSIAVNFKDSLAECTVGSYWDKNEEKCIDCKDKMPNCEECTNSYTCTKCAARYYKLDNDNDSTFEACDLCLDSNKDRYLNRDDNICYLCKNLIDGCAECDGPKKCTKCRSNPYLYRFRVEAEDRSMFSCAFDCVDGQYKTIDKVDGTGLCQFCSNLVDKGCRNCQPLSTSVANYPPLYQCTQCHLDVNRVGKDIQPKLKFIWNASIQTYNVTCGVCDKANASTSFIRLELPSNTGKEECVPCDKEWADCELCYYNSSSDYRCSKCKKDRYFQSDNIDPKTRKCLTCYNNEGFSRKMKGLTEGTYECYQCGGCADCQDETKICNTCAGTDRVLMPDNQTCNACEPKAFITRGEKHCIEVPYITNATYTQYNETSWTARVEMYCSVFSNVYWVAATNDQAIIGYTGDMIKAILNNQTTNKTFWRNTTRNPDYLMMGVLSTEPKVKNISNLYRNVKTPENSTTFYAVLNLSRELKANSRYSIIHFCENAFGVMSYFYDIENWTVQDNGSRDLELFLMTQYKSPNSYEKSKITCAVSTLLGKLTSDDKVINEEGFSCAEGKVLFPDSSRMLQAVFEDDTVIVPPRFLTNLTDFFMIIFIEKDYFARDDVNYKAIISKANSSSFLGDLQNAITSQNINITINSTFSNLTEKAPYNFTWEKTAPSVIVNFNESLPIEILNVPIPIANESMMWVEFKVALESIPGLIYFGYEKAPRDLPSPTIENFRMGKNFFGKPLDNFTIISGWPNVTYRFMYQQLSKFDPRFYRFFIAIGDHYPAPFQAIFPPQCHIYDTNPPIVVVATEDDGAKKRDIGLGVGLGLGLPIVACIIFIVVKLLQKMKGQKKERAKRNTYSDVNERELAQVLDSEKLAESKKLQDD